MIHKTGLNDGSSQVKRGIVWFFTARFCCSSRIIFLTVIGSLGFIQGLISVSRRTEIVINSKNSLQNLVAVCRSSNGPAKISPKVEHLVPFVEGQIDPTG